MSASKLDRFSTPTSGLCVLVALLVAAVPVAGLRAQTQPPSEPGTQPAGSVDAAQPTPVAETTTTDLTEERVQALLAEAEAAADLPESTKAEIIGLYQQALEQIRLAANWAAKVDEYRRGQEEAPQLLEAVRQSLAQVTSAAATPPIPDIPPDATLEQLTQLSLIHI